MRVVVVGGGVGGLATAGRLATHHEVTLLEQNGRADLGGRVGEYRWEGHRWETGASLLLLPNVYRESLEAVGDSEALDVVRVRPSYAVFFDTHLDRGPVELGGSDSAALKQRLEDEAAGAYDRYRAYMDNAGEYLRAGWPTFIEEDVKWGALARFAVNALRPNRWPLESHDSQLRKLFPESPRLRALCTFNDLYVGLSPYEAPAVFGLLSAIEIDGPRRDAGVYYLRGGLKSYAQRLVDAVEKAGVDVRCDTRVQRIETDGRRATAVVTDQGQRFDADYVVVNADLAKAEPELLGDKSRFDYSGWKYSTTSYTFLWAFDTPLDDLRHHNVFLASDQSDDDPYRSAWEYALPRSPSSRDETPPFHFYVCAASRTDASAAPPHQDSIMVLCPAPPLDDIDDGDDAATAEAIRSYVLTRLGQVAGRDLAPHLIHEKLIAPKDWRRKYGLRRGAVFSFSHGLDQLALLRPARRTSRLDNVAFVGAATRPGNGVPLVLVSAKLCAREVAQYVRRGGALLPPVSLALGAICTLSLILSHMT